MVLNIYKIVNNDNVFECMKKKNESQLSSNEFTEKMLRGILLEAQSNKELDEGDKLNDEKYREYYNGKTIALALEDKNNSRLILYPSLSGIKDE